MAGGAKCIMPPQLPRKPSPSSYGSEWSVFGMVALWHRSCGGTVPPRLGSDGLVNLIVTVRISFTGYTRETGIAGKR